MKSAYELAMERLAKASPTLVLTDEQKTQLAEIDSTYKAKIAEKELFLKDQIQKAENAGNFEEKSCARIFRNSCRGACAKRLFL